MKQHLPEDINPIAGPQGEVPEVPAIVPAGESAEPTAPAELEEHVERSKLDLDLEQLEIDLLLEGVYRRYRYDFRQYAPGSLRRRIRRAVEVEEVGSISALLAKVLHDRASWRRFLSAVAVNVTSFFRDPEIYHLLRTQVIPMLRDVPFIRIWHAGCASGEEVYSLAILLHEEGLLERSRIYATDINESALRRARAGIYRQSAVDERERSYLDAGGEGTFSDYFTSSYGNVIVRSALRERVVFAQHNVAIDTPFNEFHLIFCRNVLIYFTKILQDRVHRLLYGSLAEQGFLALGHRESLRFTVCEACFRQLNSSQPLYQRVL